jgi:hypothetical protein
VSDFHLRISEAARQALQQGEGDSERVVTIFRERVPGHVFFPSNPTPRNFRTFSRLIERASVRPATINGTPTLDFPSVFGLGQNLNRRAIGATGFLISPDIVITAAHALRRNFGVAIWRDREDGQRVPVQTLQNAADLRSVTSPTHDVGLIRLEQSVNDVEIFKFATTAEIDGVDDADLLTIVGFGFDEDGNFGTKKAASVDRREEPIPGVAVAPDLFIIGDPAIAGDGDACWHDSGGPVLLEVGEAHRAAGLIMGPVDQGVCGNGTFCLRLDRITQWIDDNIQALGGQPRPV